MKLVLFKLFNQTEHNYEKALFLIMEICTYNVKAKLQVAFLCHQ